MVRGVRSLQGRCSAAARETVRRACTPTCTWAGHAVNIVLLMALFARGALNAAVNAAPMACAHRTGATTPATSMRQSQYTFSSGLVALALLVSHASNSGFGSAKSMVVTQELIVLKTRLLGEESWMKDPMRSFLSF